MAVNNVETVRCAIYTRKSTEHGLELEFNSFDAQREACEAYVKSQASQGWRVLPQPYDDPAYSGGNLDRPALKQLLADIESGRRARQSGTVCPSARPPLRHRRHRAPDQGYRIRWLDRRQGF